MIFLPRSTTSLEPLLRSLKIPNFAMLTDVVFLVETYDFEVYKAFFNRKSKQNCQEFIKNIIQFRETVFCDFWILKAFFRPLRTQTATNFVFCVTTSIQS